MGADAALIRKLAGLIRDTVAEQGGTLRRRADYEPAAKAAIFRLRRDGILPWTAATAVDQVQVARVSGIATE